MLNYIIRRILYAIPILFGIILITFLLFNVVGGNPVYQMLGKHATQEQIKEFEHEYGFDKSLFIDFQALKNAEIIKTFDSQFVFFIKQVITFDFGRSYSSKQKITTMIADGIVPSLSLAVPSFIIGVIVALIIAFICAYYRNTLIDRFTVIASVLGMSISVLAYIIGGQYILAYKMGWLPISGYESGINAIPYLILPALIWIINSLGSDVRFFRTVILDEINQNYVRTAYAKGLSPQKTLFKHVLKNAMIPIITALVIVIPYLYTGSLLLENFFGIPGLGNMTINAIANSDFPVVKFMTFTGALIYVIFNTLSDILYSVVDPRVRLK
ncbi:MAG: peptide ABC transporter permease [Bdellovibrionales bacterium RIFOXYB2_FULL_36_6]|nr:MAG: peptide ABC transporter permease [Bdellovibrionales bacterium RIFOXYB2_FULL_36_6]OGS21804.1 MAG: peptide ABC transporter permease [Elusimicrobia bacterium RIFOXYA2_FULL_39_19]